MKKVMYGVRPLKDGERRPTKKESIAAGQVRYHGLHKIDKDMIGSVSKKDVLSTLKQSELMKEIALNGALLRNNKRALKSKNEDVVKQAEKDIKKLERKIDKYRKEYKKRFAATATTKKESKPKKVVKKTTKKDDSKPKKTVKKTTVKESKPKKTVKKVVKKTTQRSTKKSDLFKNAPSMEDALKNAQVITSQPIILNAPTGAKKKGRTKKPTAAEKKAILEYEGLLSGF